jgi:hypothetical protein
MAMLGGVTRHDHLGVGPVVDEDVLGAETLVAGVRLCQRRRRGRWPAVFEAGPTKLTSTNGLDMGRALRVRSQSSGVGGEHISPHSCLLACHMVQ